MIGRVTDQSSVIKRENAKLLQSLADSVNGRFMEIQDLSDSTHLLTGGLGLGTRPTLSKTFLEISPNLRVPCVYWGQVSKLSPPSLKKQPKSDNDDEDAMDDEAATAAIKRDITYRTPDDPDLEITVEERVKGYRYGSQYIPVTPADEENFKIPGSPIVQVIGCLPREKIPRNHFLDTPSYLHANVDSEPAQYMFGAFAQGLLEQGKVCLARLVKRENSDPSLIALIPNLDEKNNNSISFLMYRIPFADDIREYNFPSLVAFASEKQIAKNAALQKQRQTMSDYIDSMTVRPITKSSVTPMNPTLQTIYSTIHQHLLSIHEDDKIYVPDFVALTNDPERQTLVNQVYESFPLEKVEKKSKRKKVFWSDVDTTAAPEAEAAAKKPKVEIDLNQITAAINAPVSSSSALPPSKSGAPSRSAAPTAAATNIAVKSEPVSAPAAPTPSSSSAPAAQITVKEEEEEEDDLNLPDFTVGSVTPVEDFQAHIEAIKTHNPKNRKDRILKAMKILTKIIQRNVALGGSRTHYKRAVGCLVTLRQTSCEEKEYELFNTYLQTFKTNYQKGRHALAWQLATDQLITLISKDEVKSSNVTDDEAEQFLADIDNEGREDNDEDEEGVV